MCQAYEGERNFIIYGEHFASLKGFRAAMLNEPRTSNPYGGDCYNSKAWDHGHDCFQCRIFPYAMELKYQDYCKTVMKKEWYGYGLKTYRNMEEQFKKTRDLPDVLENFLPR